MSGCRKLSKEEIQEVYQLLPRLRDKVLFQFGLATGFRVSEILSVKVGDVLQYGRVIDRVRVKRSNMKGNFTRDVVMSNPLKLAIMELIQEQGLKEEQYLFKSRKGMNKPISRVQAWSILTTAFDKAKLIGPLGTHSMRKTFASAIHSALSYDLIRTQKALGHASMTSTVKYLPVDEKEVDNAILSLE